MSVKGFFDKYMEDRKEEQEFRDIVGTKEKPGRVASDIFDHPDKLDKMSRGAKKATVNYLKFLDPDVVLTSGHRQKYMYTKQSDKDLIKDTSEHTKKTPSDAADFSMKGLRGIAFKDFVKQALRGGDKTYKQKKYSKLKDILLESVSKSKDAGFKYLLFEKHHSHHSTNPPELTPIEKAKGQTIPRDVRFKKSDFSDFSPKMKKRFETLLEEVDLERMNNIFKEAEKKKKKRQAYFKWGQDAI